MIEKHSFLKLLTTHKIRPCFLDMFFGFRAQGELSEKSFGVWSQPACRDQSTVICYQFRYIERNDHKQGCRWSERQIGVYHEIFSHSDNSGVMILLHAMPGSKIQRRISKELADGTERGGNAQRLRPFQMHLLIFSSYLDEWRWYLDEIGTTCREMVSVPVHFMNSAHGNCRRTRS